MSIEETIEKIRLVAFEREKPIQQYLDELKESKIQQSLESLRHKGEAALDRAYERNHSISPERYG